MNTPKTIQDWDEAIANLKRLHSIAKARSIKAESDFKDALIEAFVALDNVGKAVDELRQTLQTAVKN